MKKITAKNIGVLISTCIALLWAITSSSAFADINANAKKCSICDLNTSVNENHDELVKKILLPYFVSGLQGTKGDKKINPAQMDLFDHYKKIGDINIIDADQSLANELSTISSKLVSFYLAGIDTKQNETESLQTLRAEDISGNTPTMTSYSNALSATNASIDTAIMNMDTLLGPLQYSNEKKTENSPPTQQENAQSLLRYIESLSPAPDVIRVSTSFKIPYTDPKTNNSPMAISLTPKEVVDLQNTLGNTPIYTNYMVAYRATVAARTMFMNNLLRIYQERVAPSDTAKKSIAATDYESATWRLQKSTDTKQPSYLDDIQNASPATLSRETVLLLAEIRYELYKSRQQNEQLIALQSLSNLQVSQLGAMMNSSKIKDVSKIIYCWYNKAQNEKTKGTDKEVSLDSSCSQTTSSSTPDNAANLLKSLQQ